MQMYPSVRRVLTTGAVALVVSTVAFGASYPNGLEDVFKGIEPGKKFHPLWPPIVGQSPLGSMVIARKPPKLDSTFESIESATFRKADSTEPFELAEIHYSGSELTQSKQLDIDVAFAQLDALAKALQTARSAATSSNASAAAPSTGETPSTSTPPGPAAQSGQPARRTTTGFDYSAFSRAERKIDDIAVQYYTAGTLFGIRDGRFVNAQANGWFGVPNNGWVIHRVLRLDGLQYSLVSNSEIAAGFLASLQAWLPGVQVRHVSGKRLAVRPPGPVYVGYKLWTPKTPFAGAAADEFDIHSVGIGADEIEKLLSPRGQ